MFNFNKENFKRILDDFYNSKKDYKDKLKKEKGINKIKKRLPNFFTKSRFAAPFFILLATLFGNYPLSLALIAIFASTDFFDGLCARKFDAFSEYGRKLDAISDKIFALGVGLPVLLFNPILVISTVTLEILIGIVNVNSELKNNEPRSTKLGKVKTWITFTSLISCYTIGVLQIPNQVINVLLLLANTTQLATLTQYIYLDNNISKTKNDKKLEINIENTNTNINLNKQYTIQNTIQNINHTEEKEKVLVKTIR